MGDAEFQKKCLGKMKDVSVNDGRTVLFVSHNMAAVKNLCNCCIVLVNGEIKRAADTTNALLYYTNLQEKYFSELLKTDKIKSTEIIKTNINIKYNELNLYSDFNLESYVVFQNDILLDNCYINFIIEDDEQRILVHHRSDSTLKENPCFHKGRHKAALFIPNLNLKAGTYNYWYRLYCKKELEDYIIDSDKISFEVKGNLFGGVINGSSRWEIY